MLEFTQLPAKPSLRLLILHDDGQREFDYTSGAGQALERAANSGWTIVSMKKRLGYRLLTPRQGETGDRHIRPSRGPDFRGHALRW